MEEELDCKVGVCHLQEFYTVFKAEGKSFVEVMFRPEHKAPRSGVITQTTHTVKDVKACDFNTFEESKTKLFEGQDIFFWATSDTETVPTTEFDTSRAIPISVVMKRVVKPESPAVTFSCNMIELLIKEKQRLEPKAMDTAKNIANQLQPITKEAWFTLPDLFVEKLEIMEEMCPLLPSTFLTNIINIGQTLQTFGKEILYNATVVGEFNGVQYRFCSWHHLVVNFILLSKTYKIFPLGTKTKLSGDIYAVPVKTFDKLVDKCYSKFTSNVLSCDLEQIEFAVDLTAVHDPNQLINFEVVLEWYFSLPLKLKQSAVPSHDIVLAGVLQAAPQIEELMQRDVEEAITYMFRKRTPNPVVPSN